MNKFLLLIFLICCVINGSGMRSFGEDNTNSLLGINLNGPADWNSELPFTDIFHFSREWISQRQGQPWGSGPKMDLDRNGWIKHLDSGCFASSPILTVKKAPLGKYTILYKGKGTFKVGGDAVLNQKRQGVAELNVKAPGLFFEIYETDPSDPIRDIRILLPGFAEKYKHQQFRPGFLNNWKSMNTYRFMDWILTNGSTVTRWSQRPTLQSSTYTTKGVPLEVMIDLCNKQSANPWFCMPHKADDEYIRRFAEMVRDKLDPTLHVYLEYSNEVWNSMFEQNKYAAEQGIKLGIGPADKPWEAAARYYVHRSLQIFKIWESVIGRKRLVRVIAWQAAGDWWTDNMILPYEEAYKHADALAIAPYFGFFVGPQTQPAVSEVENWSVDKVLDHVEKVSLPEAIGYMTKQKAIADKYGLRLICYESGQHLVGVQGGENSEKMTDLFKAANANARMGDFYTRYYDAWKAISPDLMCVFSSIGEWSKWGSWGLAQYYDDTLATSTKLKATINWISANPALNAPPMVHVADNITAKVKKPFKIKAEVTDDGKSRMSVICAWSGIGPSSPAFTDKYSPSTVVRCEKAGVYYLNLKVSDGFTFTDRKIRIEVK